MPFGGGDSGPTSSTVTQSNVPDWLRPQVEGMLASAARNLFQTTQIGTDEAGNPIYEIGEPKPYTPFNQQGEAYVAQLQPGQQQALNIANWLGSSTGGQQLINEQYGRAGDFASRMGWGGQNLAAQALGYTDPATGQFVPGFAQQGAGAGALGQQLGTQGGAYYGGLGAGYGGAAAELSPFAEQFAGQAAQAGDIFGQKVTTPGAYQAYMSPYYQNVVEQQQQGAIRQKQIADQARGAAAARSGAFGGARQAIENAEADRALQSQLQGIQAQGLQSAYNQAQQNILAQSQLGLQGLAGAQQGLGQAGQLYGLGMQGAGMGLQGLQSQLAGTAQGMQGAGMGLQGVQTGLGAYGLMGQAGTQLADITGARLRDVMGIGQFQYGMGEQQRQLAQQAINQEIQNYALGQETPYQRLASFNALLRGYAQPGQTMTQYQAPPSGISQLAALGTAGIGLGQLANVAGIGKKSGGTVSAGEGIDRIALRKALAGELYEH